jgi:subfamily B ATP-binding cassette protein HlyB/CyaB
MCLAIVFGAFSDSVDMQRAQREFLQPGCVAGTDDLVRIGRAQGYKMRASRSSVRRLNALSLPVIARHVDGTFFVIGRRTREGVLIGTGNGAPTAWSIEDLAANWTGEVLLATRRDRLAGGEVRFNLKWFLPVVRRFRRILAEVLLVSVFIQLLALAAPLFTQVVIDKVLVHRGLTTLQVLVIGLLAVHVADVLLNWLRTYVFAHTTSRMDAILGSQLFRHLVALPIGYFESRATGQTVARVRELETVRNFLSSSALTLVIDVVFGLVFLAVMAWYSLTLTLVVAASLPLYAVISLVITPLLKERVQEKFQRGAANQSLLVESLCGIQTLKAMAVEPQVRSRYEEQLAGYIGASLRVITLGAAGSQLVGLVGKVTSVLLLWFGAQAVIAGDLTIGEFVAFTMLAGQVSGPVLRLAQLWQDFQQFRLSVDRLGDILNAPVEPGTKGLAHTPPALRGHVRFERIGFRYRPDGAEVLRDLNLEIRPGEVVGIVGRSGSGKSTLTKLLQRLYQPERGRCWSTGSMSGCSIRPGCAGRSGWCCRRTSCSTAASAITSPSRRPRPPSRR